MKAMKLNLNNTEDFEIIAKYLAREMSNEEVSRFEKLIESSPENKNIVEEMKKQWENIGVYQKRKEIDTNKGWESLHDRLSSENLIPENNVIEHRIAPVWVKWAATVAVLMVIASVSFFSINRHNSNLISLQTGNESNTLIQTLTDGSVVYLANNTTFSYPSQFSSDERRVNLKGEAFFDITSNPKKPFRIETDQVIVEVLGTAFNVKSENGNSFELAVERGKVRVTLKSNPSQSQIVLPGEKISTSNNRLVKEKNNNSSYFAWRTIKMRFKDETLNNVLNVINKNYHTNLKLQNQAIGEEKKLNVIFQNNSIDEITNIICAYYNLQAEEKSDSIIILKSIEK
jgi:transmembrane sensor